MKRSPATQLSNTLSYNDSSIIHFADLGIDDNCLVIDSGGNVGIGTSTPGAKLSVATTTDNANTNNTAIFSASNIGDNTSDIHWGNTGDWYIRSAASSGNVILQDTGDRDQEALSIPD